MAATPGAAAAGPGTLFLVPTPIGNPADITRRAVAVLQAVDVVAAEDTRIARTICRRLDLRPSLVSYYDHTEQSRAGQLVELLSSGQDVALISDAGTPLLNDPGYRLVTAAIAAGIRVRPLPGASAVLTALIGSGLPVHRFHYAGFLPRKQAARRGAIKDLAGLPATLILFEAPHRLVATLSDLRDTLGDRDAALARNLSKDDEEFLRGPLSRLAAELAGRGGVRGEYTIVVAGAAERDFDAADELAGLGRALLRHGVAAHVARDVLKEVTGLPRNRVYRQLQALQEEDG